MLSQVLDCAVGELAEVAAEGLFVVMSRHMIQDVGLGFKCFRADVTAKLLLWFLVQLLMVAEHFSDPKWLFADAAFVASNLRFKFRLNLFVFNSGVIPKTSVSLEL